MDYLLAALRMELGSCPSRLRILRALDDPDEVASGEVARRAGMSPTLASFHLKRLLEFGAVERRRKGQQILYRLSPSGAAVLRAAHVALSGR